MLEIDVQRASSLIDEDTKIVISGFKPGEDLALSAELLDELGQRWKALLSFTGNEASHTIPLSQINAAMRYSGVSAKNPGRWLSTSLYRALSIKANGRDSTNRKFCHFSDKALELAVHVSAGQAGRASSTIPLHFRQPKNEYREIASPFRGKYFPAADGKRGPAVLVLGGSAGGFRWSEQAAALLQSRGYHALAVAYFDYHGRGKLPRELSRIALEYFDQAVDWLQNRPEVEEQRIGILGLSKGSEAAMLYTDSFQNRITALAAYVPPSYSFEGAYLGKQKNIGSWTLHSRELPFLPYPGDSRFFPVNRDGLIRQLHEEAIKSATPESRERAAITLSDKNLDVLLISAGRDGTWPSSEMCAELVERNQGACISHHDYPDAGHVFLFPHMPPYLDDPALSPVKAAAANSAAWEEVKSFFARTL